MKTEHTLHLESSDYQRGYVAGLSVGLALFEAKLTSEQFKSICYARIGEIDRLLEKSVQS